MAPIALAVMDTPPNSDFPSGFSPRWEFFLRAVSRRFHLKIFATRQADAQWTKADFRSPRLADVGINIDDAPSNPLWGTGHKARLLRLRHYAMDRAPAKAYPVRFDAIERELAAGAPSIVISFLPTNTHLVRLLAGKAPLVAVLEEGHERTIHGKGSGGRDGWAAERELRLIRNAYTLTGRYANRAVVISDAEADWFSPFIDRKKLVCIDHGIDAEYFAPAEAESRYDIAVIGEMSHPRNHRPARSLFDFMEGKPETRGLRWAFVGRQPDAALLEIASSKVTVPGWVPDLRPYYSAARVVVVPGILGTGVKTTVLQAWGMGRPLVATPFAVGGTRHHPGSNVLIGDSDAALGEKIEWLLGNRERAEAMGKAGRETACGDHNIRVIAERFADLCEEVSSEPALGRP